jgi:predicted permease
MSGLSTIIPIFALISAGWLVRRLGVIGAQGMTELNRFVVWLALPALLFDITAHARLADIWQPGFIAVFGLSTAVVFVLTLALRLKGRRLADATLDGLGAAYGNVAYMGFPIMAAAVGASGMIAATIATLITVCALFAVAVAMIEAGLQAEARTGRLALKVGKALLKNPLVMAPILGVVLAAVGFAIPDPAEKALKMLGSTASPCALVTIGLFLAAKAPAQDARSRALSTATLVALKLLLQPAIAFGLAILLRLPAPVTRAAVLLAAMPTGTGPFMLAEFYGREAGVTSRAILVSTVASAATLWACIAFAG